MEKSKSQELLEQFPEVWKHEYEDRILVDNREGRIAMPGPEDRRKMPRLKLRQGKNVWVHVEKTAVPILDISAVGIAFYSDVERFPGDTVSLNVAELVSIEAVVISSDIEETNPDFLEFKYRVRAKFAPGLDGYRIYVLARDIYIHNLENPLDTVVAN